MMPLARLLLVNHNGTTRDISKYVSEIRWAGRKGAPARSITPVFLDDAGHNRGTLGFDIEDGHRCVFLWKNQELFRGLMMHQDRSQRKIMPVKAYDLGIYLLNNRDTFCYENIKATEVFHDCCARFGIPVGDAADTGYIIPALPKPKTTAWDTITDALSITNKATGVRFYPMCRGESMNLIERRSNILQWVIETGANIERYTQTTNLGNLRTRIQLISREGAVLAQATNADLERRLGVFQDIIRVNDELNEGQLTQLVNNIIQQNNAQQLTITALGQSDIISGVGVFVMINPLGISRTYYVDEDMHTFKGNSHKMRVTLRPADDTNGFDIQTNVGRGGEIVYFLGGPQYAHSMANEPMPQSGIRRAGFARVIGYIPGARQPYELHGGAFALDVSGNSNVRGWVPASAVRR